MWGGIFWGEALKSLAVQLGVCPDSSTNIRREVRLVLLSLLYMILYLVV
jgi:hypothetical protein